MSIENRTEQRLSNFTKTLTLLTNSFKKEIEDERDIAGIIQFYEMTIELSWKCLRDYLLNQQYEDPMTPKACVKAALNYSFITEKEAETWLKGLNLRNLTSHTYDEETAHSIVKRIKSDFLPLLSNIHQKLSNT